jgi:hypothetical protein
MAILRDVSARWNRVKTGTSMALYESVWIAPCKEESGIDAPGNAPEGSPCPPDKVAAIKQAQPVALSRNHAQHVVPLLLR